MGVAEGFSVEQDGLGLGRECESAGAEALLCSGVVASLGCSC